MDRVFTIKTEKRNNYIIFFLTGRIDIIAANEMEDEFNKLIENGEKNIIIDFSETMYFSSSGMRVIISLKNKLDEIGGKLKLCSLHSMVEKIMRSLQLLSLYKVYNNLDEALNAD